MKNALILYPLIVVFGMQLASCRGRIPEEAIETGIQQVEKGGEQEAEQASHSVNPQKIAQKLINAQPEKKIVVFTRQEEAWISRQQISLLPQYKQEICQEVYFATLLHMQSVATKASLDSAQETAQKQLQQYNSSHRIIMTSSSVTLVSSAVGAAAYNSYTSDKKPG